jgi:protein SCO1/2
MFRSGRLAAAAALTAAMLGGCGASGKAAPDFTLTSDAGQPWTLSAQHGKPVLLTFGFSHCADTCPETLAKLAHLTQHSLGGAGSAVEIVMVTVDPRRDSPAALHAFVSRFDRPIVGLTGSRKQIDAVESAYGVWAQPVPGKHGGQDYDVAHTATIFLIDAGGHIRGLHQDDDSEAAIARSVREMSS